MSVCQMFKVIRDFVEKPQFLILCDRACGQYAVAELAQVGVNEEAQQALWAGSLQKAGWRITLSEQVCPRHVQQERGEESRIIVPSMTAGWKN